MMFSFPFYGRRYGGGRRKTKKSKPRKDSWFEECTVDQLKQLCKACKMPVSGAKGALVSRLQENDFSSGFGGNRRSSNALFGPCGNVVTIDQLKALCRTQLLAVSGKKFDLVLRLCQNEHKTTGRGETLKRAAQSQQVVTTTADGETVVQHVAKKRKPSKPSPKVFYTRVQKKIRACLTQKKYQTHLGSKGHPLDVTILMESLMKEAEEFRDSEPVLLLDCYQSIISSFVENFQDFTRPGYLEDIDSIASRIQDNLMQVWEQLPPSGVNKMARALEDLAKEVSGYCLLEGYDMEKAVEQLRKGPSSLLQKDAPNAPEDGNDGTKPSDDEDQKPSAVDQSPSNATAATTSEQYLYVECMYCTGVDN